jgi:prevent-host-death family protein
MSHLPETYALTDFRANAARHIQRLRRSDKPTLLTQNGKGAVIVMSPELYEQLAADADLARSIAAIQESLDDPRPDISWQKFSAKFKERREASAKKRR